MKVWIALVHHEYGTTTHAAASRKALTNSLYEYVCEWWAHELPDRPFPKSRNKEQVVRQYFALLADISEEYVEILNAVQVQQ